MLIKINWLNPPLKRHQALGALQTRLASPHFMDWEVEAWEVLESTSGFLREWWPACLRNSCSFHGTWEFPWPWVSACLDFSMWVWWILYELSHWELYHMWWRHHSDEQDMFPVLHRIYSLVRGYRSSPEPLEWEHWLQDPRLPKN